MSLAEKYQGGKTKILVGLKCPDYDYKGIFLSLPSQTSCHLAT